MPSEYLTPGGAMAGALEEILARKKAEARQQMLDQIAAQNHKETSEFRRLQIQSAAEDRAQKILDAKQKDVASELSLYSPEDTLDETLVKRANDAQMQGWLKTQQAQVRNPQGETPETFDTVNQTRRRQTPEEMQAEKIQKIISDPQYAKNPRSAAGALIPVMPKEAGALAKEWIGGNAPNLQRDTQLYQGKPVDVFISPDPNGAKILLPTPNGLVDITGQTQHWEKPAAPSTLWGSGGLMIVDKEKGIARPVTEADILPQTPTSAPGGQPAPPATPPRQVQPQTTAQTRAMMEGAKMLQPHIEQVRTMAADLDKAGLFGPVMSRMRDGMTKVGTIDEFINWVSNDPVIQAESAKDPLVGNFTTSLSLLASGAGRVHGGARGGGSPQMYGIFKQALSDAATFPMFSGRLDALNEYMSGYAAGPAPTTPPAATPAPAPGAPPPGPPAPKKFRYDMNGKLIQ